MSFFLRHFAGFLIQIGGGMVLCMFSFTKEAFRYPRKWVIAGYTALTILFSAGFPLVMCIPLFQGAQYQSLAATAYMLFVILLFTVLYFWIIRAEIIKKLVVLVLVLFYTATQYLLVNLVMPLFPDSVLPDVYPPLGLALYAGIAGGADIILLPEIPYDIDVVVNAIRSRTKNGKNFTILAVAEGAISKENAALTKKELKEKKKNGPVYPSVAYELGAQISERTGQEIRVTVPGHMQRGGEPCPYDRVIATRLGAEAAEMIRRKEYGYMVALNNNKIEKIPLADIAGKLKMVDPKSDIIREAKDVGISFGDE